MKLNSVLCSWPVACAVETHGVCVEYGDSLVLVRMYVFAQLSLLVILTCYSSVEQSVVDNKPFSSVRVSLSFSVRKFNNLVREFCRDGKDLQPLVRLSCATCARSRIDWSTVPIIDSSSSNGRPNVESDKLELEFEIVEARLSQESVLEIEDSEIPRLVLKSVGCLVWLAIGLSITDPLTTIVNIFER